MKKKDLITIIAVVLMMCFIAAQTETWIFRAFVIICGTVLFAGVNYNSDRFKKLLEKLDESLKEVDDE